VGVKAHPSLSKGNKMSIDNTRPAFRILAASGFYGPDDHLYVEGDEIYYDGEPNEEMEPLNEAARTKMSAYIEKLDASAKAAADKAGKAFVERPKNLDGALALATAVARSEMSIMGVKKDVNIVERVDSTVEETGTANPKRGRGRPRLQHVA